jgi:hypothetical protein
LPSVIQTLPLQSKKYQDTFRYSFSLFAASCHETLHFLSKAFIVGGNCNSFQSMLIMLHFVDGNGHTYMNTCMDSMIIAGMNYLCYKICMAEARLCVCVLLTVSSCVVDF